MIIDIIIGGALGIGIGLILKRFFKFNKLTAFLTAAAVWLVLLLFLTFAEFVAETPTLLVSAIAISLYSCIYTKEFTDKYNESSNQKRYKCTYCSKEIINFENIVVCKNCKHIYHKKCLPTPIYCPQCTEQTFLELNNFKETKSNL